MRKRDAIRAAKWDYEDACSMVKEIQKELRIVRQQLKNEIANKRAAKKAWFDSMK